MSQLLIEALSKMLTDIWLDWGRHFVGYFFCVLISQFVGRITNLMKPSEQQNLGSWQVKMLGCVEQILYITALLIGQWQLIGVWLAMKVAGKWKAWDVEFKKAEGTKEYGEVLYGYLVGIGVSLLIASSGYIYILGSTQDSELVLPGVTLFLLALFVCARIAACRSNRRASRPMD